MYKIELIHTRTFYKRERKPVFEHAHACLTFFTLFDFFKIKTLFFEQFQFIKLKKRYRNLLCISCPHTFLASLIIYNPCHLKTFLKNMKTRLLLGTVKHPPDKNGQRASGSGFNSSTNFLRVQ